MTAVDECRGVLNSSELRDATDPVIQQMTNQRYGIWRSFSHVIVVNVVIKVSVTSVNDFFLEFFAFASSLSRCPL